MKDLTRYEILVTSFLLLVQFNTIGSIHLSGTFDTNDYFKFITRFGIQATDSHKQKNTQGYIYGNISLEKNTQLPANSLIMLTLLDYNYFIDYYANRLVQPATTSCSMMFEKMEKTAFFYECNQKKGTLDFIRRVPCPHDKLCIDEDEPTNVLENFQFTFTINDLNQARFWYVSLVACVRDTKTCQWRHLGDYQEEESDQPINGTLNYTKIYKRYREAWSKSKFDQIVAQMTVDTKNKLSKSLNKSRDALTPKASTSRISIRKLTSTPAPPSPQSSASSSNSTLILSSSSNSSHSSRSSPAVTSKSRKRIKLVEDNEDDDNLSPKSKLTKQSEAEHKADEALFNHIVNSYDDSD